LRGSDEGYFGTVLIYILVALAFFYIGKNYDRLKEQME
jgi:hypothetical protein